MYTAREKAFWFAVYSRIFIFLLQIIFNAICPDHRADAFISPIDPNENYSFIDHVVILMFEGLTRWDAQYYIHIAKYGYTYENTLAFYPLLPMLIRYISVVLCLKPMLLSYSSIIVISGVLINFVCFIKATLTLYDLSEIIFKNTKVAYRAAIFFCINPASIFFSAIYTESIFAYLTFYSMLESVKNNRCVFIPIGLSSLVRSNGLINIGFPIYIWLKDILKCLVSNYISDKKLHNYSNKFFFSYIKLMLISTFQIISIIILSFLPFCLLQIYNYTKFCKPEFNEILLSDQIQQYAKDNNLLLPGKYEFSWCNLKVPLAYSYVQSKYWNVGFLTYYQFKQIPNFVLAFPVLYLMVKCIIKFFKEHKSTFLTLEFINDKAKNHKFIEKYPLEMFVFIVHGLFLTLFCIFFVHIQISTRLLCSASPLLYWHCALETLPKLSNQVTQIQYESHENKLSKWKMFFFNQQQYSHTEKLIFSYFLGYVIIGSFMYSNFLPWT